MESLSGALDMSGHLIQGPLCEHKSVIREQRGPWGVLCDDPSGPAVGLRVYVSVNLCLSL